MAKFSTEVWSTVNERVRNSDLLEEAAELAEELAESLGVTIRTSHIARALQFESYRTEKRGVYGKAKGKRNEKENASEEATIARLEAEIRGLKAARKPVRKSAKV